MREHAGESQIPTSFAGTNRSRFEGLRLVPHSQRLCLAAGRSPVVHHEPTHRGRSSPSRGSNGHDQVTDLDRTPLNVETSPTERVVNVYSDEEVTWFSGQP